MDARGDGRQQTIARHGIKNSRLAEHHHQDHRSQAEDDADLEDRRKETHADGVDPDGDRIRHVELVVRHNPGQHEADRDIEHRAYRQRAENPDRHVALRVLGFLRGGRNGVEPDIGEEHHRGAAQNAAQPELALANVWRNEIARRVCRGHPMRRAHERCGDGDEHQNNDELDGDDHHVGSRRLTHPDNEHRRDRHDYKHRWNIEDGAGRMPSVRCRIIGERSAVKSGRHDNAEILEKAHHVARPADRNRGGAEHIFEDQIPADDPGDEFAQGRVGISVGAAGNRHRRRHLRVAQSGEDAGDRAKHERERDCWSGVGGSRMSGQHKNTGPDDGADAERDEVDCRQRTRERHLAMRDQRLGLRLFRLRLQHSNGFASPNTRHRPSYKPAAASAAAWRLPTRSMEKFSIASLKSR